MMQGIAIEGMHNGYQSNDAGVRNLNIYDINASSIEGYVIFAESTFIIL